MIGLIRLTTLSSCKRSLLNQREISRKTVLRNEANQAVASRTQQAARFEKSLRLSRNPMLAALPVTSTETTVSLPIFKSLVAAVVKTGLADVLATPNLNATVFAPTDAAFAKLPAPLTMHRISVLFQILHK